MQALNGKIAHPNLVALAENLGALKGDDTVYAIAENEIFGVEIFCESLEEQRDDTILFVP